MSRWLFSSLVFLAASLSAASLNLKMEQLREAMPVHFEQNRGLVPGGTQWIARSRNGTMYISPNEVVFELMERPNTRTRNVHMRFVGASGNAAGIGSDAMGAYANHFAGRTEHDWFTGIPLFGKVTYANVYPGIDLVYYGNQRKVEYDFVVAPGADAVGIQIAFDGADSVRLDAAGDLVIAAGAHEIRQRHPRVLQGGMELDSRYVLDGIHRVRMEINGRDARRPLTIDPVIELSTFLGGPGDDGLYGVTFDKNGFLYVCGYTQTPAAPILDPFQQQNIVNYTPIIFKFTADVQKLVYYSTIDNNYGGRASSIAVDGTGSAVVVGSTSSTNLPLKNPIQAQFNGGYDNGFITRFSSDGKTILYSTYLGGSVDDVPMSVVLDSANNIYLTGLTRSTDFPTKNAIQSKYGGSDSDCMVAKISTAGALVFSTFLGGTADDQCSAITIAPDGGVIISGESNGSDFPLKNETQTQISPATGDYTALLAKLTPDGALVFSTYIGGPVRSYALAVTTDGAGNIYVAGSAVDKFITKNAYQSSAALFAMNAFVAKFDSTAQHLLYATLLGGSKAEQARAIAIDASGNMVIAGTSSSPDFPGKGALQDFKGGGINNTDDFVAKFSASGALVYSTLVGGSGGEGCGGLALDAVGNAYVVGTSGSQFDFPIRTAYQHGYGGGRWDGFILKMSDNTPVSASPLTPGNSHVVFNYVQGGTSPALQNVSVAGSAALGFTATPSASWLSVSPVSATTPASLGITVNPAGLAPGNYTATISLSPALGTPTSVDVALTVQAAGPLLQALTPSFVALGSNDTAITLQGSGFTSNSKVLLFQVPWTDTPVIFVNSTTLQIVIPNRYFTVANAFQFSVQNPLSVPSAPQVLSVGRPAPQISSGGVVNAASYSGAAVSPGEIVTIFGANFGTQDNMQVLFDGLQATLLYVTPTQLGATVPYATPAATTSLVIKSQGQSSAPIAIPVVPATPSIFTTDASGKGQGAILNQDSSINGATNPAAAGSVVVLYGTGGGILTSDSPARLALPVSATIGGLDAPVLYAGIAPGLVSGAVQINLQVPIGVQSGAVPVILQVGDARSRADVTLAVQ